MKGYFGGKEILQVVLDGKTLYKKSSGVELPPPETLIVSRYTFQNAFISYSTVPPTEAVSYSNNCRMTGWVGVRPNTSYLINEYLTNQCVIQLKDALGNITNLTQFQGLTSVNNVVFPTGNNTFVRIYFYAGGYGANVRDVILTEQRG